MTTEAVRLLSEWWSSLEAVKRLHVWIRFSPVVLSALGALLGTWLVVKVGNRVEWLESERRTAEQARERAARADETVSLKRDLDAAQGELARLTARQAARALAPEQRRMLVEKLRREAGALYNIKSLEGDLDGYQYALQIIEVLQAAGWRGRVIPEQAHARPVPSGVRVPVRARDRITVQAGLFVESLLDVGVEDVAYELDTQAREDLVEIRVGVKRTTG